MTEQKEINKLKNFLNELTKLDKSVNKMGAVATSELSNNMEKIIKEATVDFERRMKINKKSALVSLMKDKSVKIVFDNPEDAVKFAKGEK